MWGQPGFSEGKRGKARAAPSQMGRAVGTPGRALCVGGRKPPEARRTFEESGSGVGVTALARGSETESPAPSACTQPVRGLEPVSLAQRCPPGYAHSWEGA